MSSVGMTYRVSAGVWNDLNGVWVKVTPLDDPLLSADHARVTVYTDQGGHLWAQVAGPNAGVDVRTVPPHTMDFAITNGEPL